jgi:DNA-binding protein YbaB
MRGTDDFDVWQNPEAARARIQEQLEQAQRAAVKATAVRDQIAAIRGTATSRDRAVTAVCDASGALLDLELADDVQDANPRALAQQIVATVREATAKAGAQAVAVAQEAFGEDSATANQLRAEVADREARREAPGISYT